MSSGKKRDVKKRSYSMRSEPWSKRDLQYLKTTTHLKAAAVANILKRSSPAVSQMRRAFNLSSTRPPKWTAEIVKTEIRKRHKKRMALQAGFMNHNVKPLFRAAVRIFGSWK